MRASLLGLTRPHRCSCGGARSTSKGRLLYMRPGGPALGGVALHGCGAPAPKGPKGRLGSPSGGSSPYRALHGNATPHAEQPVQRNAEPLGGIDGLASLRDAGVVGCPRGGAGPWGQGPPCGATPAQGAQRAPRVPLWGIIEGEGPCPPPLGVSLNGFVRMIPQRAPRVPQRAPRVPLWGIIEGEGPCPQGPRTPGDRERLGRPSHRKG